MKNLPRGGGGHSHSYSSSSYERINGDSYYHNKICDSCGERQREAHYYNITSGNESICGDCGYVYVKQCEHNSLDFYQEVLATCTEPGMRWHYKCRTCGKFVDDYGGNEITEVVIAALGHKLEKIEKREPTCIEEGSEEHYKCSNFGCDKFFKDADGKEEADENELRIPILEHTYVNGKCEFCGCPPPLIIDGIGYVYIENGGYYVVSTIADEEATEAVIKSEIFGNPVMGIYYYAFRDCSSLTSVTIPDSITYIGGGAFSGCSGLTSVTIPDSVTSIGSDAFSGCSGLTSIMIPDSITDIGWDAFSGCNGLTSITIPDGVTNIGRGAFSGCSGLTEITVPFVGASKDGTDAYFGYIFGAPTCYNNNSYVPQSLKKVTITGGTCIGNYAFYNCSNLTSVTIPDSVTNISRQAFSGCSGLTSITIPDSVTSIGWDAFRDCSSLTSIAIPDSVTDIGSEAFRDCSSLISITISDSVTNISRQTFYNCNNVETLVIGNRITSLANLPITSALKSIIIPNSITSIEYSTFYSCNNVETLVIGDGITSLANLPMTSALKSITIGSGVTFIGDAFSGCSNLTSLTVSENNAEYKSYENCIYTKDGKTLIRVTTGLTSITIPDSVTNISRQAFSGCSGLTSVVIPDSVTSIGYGAFYGCSSLTNITIPDSVTNIGNGAFSGCSGLTEITVPFVGASKNGTNAYFGYIFGAPTYYGNDSYVPQSLKKVTITDGSTVTDTAFYDVSYRLVIIIPIDFELLSEPKSSYYYGDTLDLSALKIVGKFSGGYSKSFSYSSSDVNISGLRHGESLVQNGTVSATVSYYGNSKAFEFPITVHAVKELEFSADCKTDYYYGDSSVTLDLEEFGLCAVYDDGTKRTLPVNLLSSSPKAGTTLAAGSQTVELSCTCNGKTCSTSIDVTVHSVTSVDFSSNAGSPEPKTEYYCGEYLDLSNFQLYAMYDDGKTVKLTSSDWEAVPANNTRFMNAGNQTVTFSCRLSGRTWTVTKRITVKPARVSSITYKNSWRILFQQAEDWRLNCRGEERFDVTLTDGTETSGSKIENATLYIGSKLLTGAAVNRTITEHTIPADLEEGWYDNCYVMLDGKKSENFKMYVVPSWETVYKGNRSSSSAYISMDTDVTKIGINAFMALAGVHPGVLKAVEIPTGVTRIDESAFRLCKELEFVEIPANVTYISSEAFWDCDSLVSIVVPAKVTTLVGNVFGGCGNLKSITVESGNTKYQGVYNCIVDRETKELVTGCKNSTIPNAVTSIGTYAFAGIDFETILIPNGVKSIGNRAFYVCNIKEITISSSVRSIEEKAFEDCTNLTSITMRSSAPPNFGSNCFQNVTATMYVPVGSKSNYEQALSASSHKGTITIEER